MRAKLRGAIIKIPCRYRAKGDTLLESGMVRKFHFQEKHCSEWPSLKHLEREEKCKRKGETELKVI